MDKTAAILVNYDLYETDTEIRQFVLDREGKAALVALVYNPLQADPDLSTNIQPEWDVMIRNPKGFTDQVFTTMALSAVTASSNMIPVLFVTPSGDTLSQEIFYDAGGLLVVNHGTLY